MNHKSVPNFCTIYRHEFLRPSDDAFAEVDQDVLAKLLEPSYILHLRNLLAYHVTTPTPELLLSTGLMDGMVLNMLNEENVTLSITGSGVSVVDGFGNESDVDRPDITATDGTIHVVDEVLVPAFLGTNLIELASQVPELSLLAELMAASGADDLVPPGGDFTILAPNNAA